MDSTLGSKTVFDSIFVCQESALNINLNTSMLMPIDDDILSSDDIFYAANEAVAPLNRVKGIGGNVGKIWQFSHIFKNIYSRSLSSLPNIKHYEDNKNYENYAVDSLHCLYTVTSPNLSSTQHSNAKKANNETSNHFSLNVFLKRMLHNILGKHTNSAKELKATSCNKTFGNKISLNKSFSTSKLGDTCHTNSNLTLCQIPNSDKNISLDENLKDPSNDNIFTNISSKNISTFFTNRIFPNKLVTTLENSNEDTITTIIERSSHCCAKYTDWLTKFFPQNLETKCCMGKSIYDATDAEGSESDTFLNASNNIKLSEQILLMPNNLENNNDSGNFTPQHVNEMIDITDISNEDYNTFSDISLEIKESDSAMGSVAYDNSVENQTSSSWTYSEVEESDYSSTFPVALKIVNKELSNTHQSLHEEVDSTTDSAINVEHNEKSIKDTSASPSKVSPILKKRVKQKRSLSLASEVADAKNNKMLNKRLNSTSSPLRGRCKSPCIIISPIKSVEYLKSLFTNISRMNKKSMQPTPTMHKLRRSRIPFTSITPPTPK